MIHTYQNPILSGFYPDPSICRVGHDYFIVNSTFGYFPGIPIFHSTGLIHWKQIGNVIHRPGQIDFSNEGISRGLFAPTIRFYKNHFYVLCTAIGKAGKYEDGNFIGGNFIVTAENPSGPWSDPVWLDNAPGIDPSIFFDDDGKVWYVGNRPAPEGMSYRGNYEIWIQEIDLSLLEKKKNPLIGEPYGIWRGALRDCIWPEGPHIYKINSFYYLLHAEGGTGMDHAVCIARSKDIKGPWIGKRSNPVLTHRHLGKNAEIINVGHADLFDDHAGNWWMVLLASRPFPQHFNKNDKVCPLGRETFIVPVRWEDGWPFISTKSGLVEIEYSLPENIFDKVSTKSPGESACDHFFNLLPPYWLTIRMPGNEKDMALSLISRPGYLRLFTKAATMRSKGHPAFAGRRIKHKNWMFSASIEFQPRLENESAGIILLQNENYQYRLEIFLYNNKKHIRLLCADGKEDKIVIQKECKESGNSMILAASSDELNLSFFYGPSQYCLTEIAANIEGGILSTEYSGGFVGTLAGVFASGNGEETKNHADVLWAEYRGL
jgi:alpha-N-arabinofuranosidase